MPTELWRWPVFEYGIAGTVVGAGVGSAHLAKAGLDAAAVLAVIVLAASLVLLIWGPPR